MFYVSSIRNDLVGITDTYDNVEEFYTPSQIKEISKQIKIKGVTPKGIKKINLGIALLTREVIEKIDCKKSLSFEVVDNLVKYMVLSTTINDDFALVETNTDIKLISDKTIMLNVGNTWKGLFEDTNFTKIDFHNTDTSKVWNVNSMFKGCHAVSLDLSCFNTCNVRNMCEMFDNCQATSLDLSNFDTSNVRVMTGMFKSCQATYINVSSFNTSNVRGMHSMFKDCQAAYLDLNSFDTHNVKIMGSMFENYKGTIKASDSRILEEYKARILD